VDAAAVDAASELDGGTTDAALDTDAAASLDGATLPDASMRDAGADAGAEAGARDGSAASPDAASAPAASAGCGCRASNGRAPGLVLACVISIALLAGRRARRRGLRATAVAPQVDGFRR
jgi:hypothetical protein